MKPDIDGGAYPSTVAASATPESGRLPRTFIWVVVVSAGVTAAILAWVLAGQGLQAVFGPIDDHEPLLWMGSDGWLGWSESLPTLLQQTEVGGWPNGSRFRPSYYILRVGQAVLFGDDPRLWYLSVLFAYAVTCAAAGVTFAIAMDWAGRWRSAPIRWVVGGATASTGAVIVGGLHAWSGIITRLGPSELLALLCTTFVLLGTLMLARSNDRRWWVAILLGTFGAVLAKESFILVSAVGAITGGYRYFGRDRRPLDGVLGIVSLVPAAILVPVFLGIDTDVNGGDGGGARVGPGLDGAFRVFLTYWIPASFALGMAFVVWWWSRGRGHRALSVYVLALCLWAVMILWGDVVFYGGVYQQVRYWAVFDFSKTLQILAAIALVLAAARRSRGWIRGLALAVLIIALGLTLRLVTASATEFGEIRAQAAENRSATQQYASDMDESTNMVTALAGAQFALVVPASVEYEPARAILIELARTLGPDHPRFLIVDIPAARDDGDTARALKAVSESGSDAWSVSTISRLDPALPTVCGFVNVDPYPVTGCTPDRSVRIEARGM